MTEVGFYHLTTRSLDWALARLLDRALSLGKRAVVLAGSTERVEALSAQLWTFDPNSFLPHGTARDGEAEHQPVWLTPEDENPNGAQFVLLIDGQETQRLGDYERGFEVFDGRDPAQVERARTHWTAYKAAGHEVTYWRQTEAGGWEKGA
ncbi:MAG: DNA polymerase III subunit chi [Alphaproteobacteria bacterium]|nr:DNA polymerase III subunit chi [Alphaproteobacteria bacterium]